MKIIIAGCGKIGTSMVEDLVAEGHDILVIDNDESVIRDITNIHDVMGVCGNCVDSDVLEDANVRAAELYIAVTDSDELNMLSCFLAKKMGVKNTIARIRTPEYNDKSLQVMKNNLEISMPINPERLAARELFNILKFPSAVKLETFSNRNMEMLEINLKEDSVFHDVKLSEIHHKFKAKVLICCVQRGEDVYIPNGNWVLKSGDKIGIIASHAELQRLFKITGLFKKQARNVIILGGSRVAFYLAQMLCEIGTSVKIIDKDEKVCEALGDMLPKAVVICGDGTQQELLMREGLSRADAFVSLTGLDETNILISMFASRHNVPKVITKINREELISMAEELGLDTIVSPKRTVSNVVVSYARAVQNSLGSNVEMLYKLMDDRAEALEFNVREDSRMVGIPLKDMKLRKHLLIIGIIRDRKVITPTGNTEILVGDRVVVITTNHGLGDLSDIMER
ncbi:MAG: Trk system potassium transporter TrkA [Clostridia bacterium]|nr:Trk system potassium transporter TrkA [Clostridia bacterium]